MTFRSSIRAVTAYNTRTFLHRPISELSGSLGDLGTLLPLFLSLSLAKSISPSSTLVFSGLANIASGFLFGVPIPVQPMKAIAAAALDGNFSLQRTVAAGVEVSAVVFLLALTGLLTWLGRVVPSPIVRGVQCGAGLQLIVAAGNGLLRDLGWVRPRWSDNHLWTLGTFVFLLLCEALVMRRRTMVPFAFVVTIIGVLLAILSDDGHSSAGNPGLWHPHIYQFGWRDFRDAVPTAVGQLPLTTLNSILATSHLAAQLLPSQPNPSLAHLGLSLSITNFISAPFGAMPVCHGSGGLAGQYRFGARSGASVIILGVIKLLLGLFAAGPVVWVIGRFPRSILGIMVITAGVELAKVAEGINKDSLDLREVDGHFRSPGEEERKKRFTVMLVTISGILAFKNDAVGFCAGLAWHSVINAEEIWGNRSRWLSYWRRNDQGEQEPLIH